MKIKNKKKIGIVLGIYVLLMLITYVYCLPESENIVGTVIFNSLIASPFGYVIISQLKMLKWEGALEYSKFRKFCLFAPYVFSIPMLILMPILIFLTIMRKDYEYMTLLLPTITILHGSYKAYYMNKKMLDEYGDSRHMIK